MSENENNNVVLPTDPPNNTPGTAADNQQKSNNTGTNSGMTSGGDIFRVSVKVPDFWPDRPDVWFAQLEAQFALSKITTDETKFYHVISQLGNQHAAEVIDIIKSPPAENKYEKLKSEIIKRLTASHEKKVKQLLHHEELGDRRPSQFLRHLQSLAGSSIPEDFLRTIWSSRLPHNVQTIVATQSDTALEKVAELADKIYELTPSCPQVAAASTSNTTMPPYMAEMAKQIAELTKCVARLSRPRSRSSSYSRSDSRGRSTSPRPYSMGHRRCWYHRKFGARAERCLKPCDFDAGNSKDDRQ